MLRSSVPLLALALAHTPLVAAQEACPVTPLHCTAPPGADGPSAQRVRTSSGPRGEPGTPAHAAAAALTRALELAARAAETNPIDVAMLRAARDALGGILRDYPNLDELRLGGDRAWPTEYGLRHRITSLSARLGDRAAVIRDVEAVLARWPAGDATDDLLHSAAQATYDELPAEQGPRTGGGAAPRELTDAERTFVQAGTRYVCRVQTAEANVTRYRLASVHYGANHYEEAASGFRVIAMQHPSDEFAVPAANAYLDSLNQMASGAPEPNAACLLEIRDALDPLTRLYCGAPGGHPQLCGMLSRMACVARRLDAEALAVDGRHGDAATAYLDAAQNHPECGGIDEVIYNAALEYEADFRSESAIRTHQMLIDLFPLSRLVRRSIYSIAVSYHTFARYREAADEYMAFARLYPGETSDGCSLALTASRRCPDARTALRNAIYFYGLLHESELASTAIQLYERNYQRRDPSGTAEVVFGGTRLLSEAQDWRGARTAWDRWLRRHASRASAHRVVQALVRLGHAHAELGDHRGAERRYGEVVERWRTGDLLSRLSESHALQARSAVAEAMFRRTDRRARAFMVARRPSLDDLETIESELGPIADLDVPEWSIAASARLAELYLHASVSGPADRADALAARANERAAHCARLATAARQPSEAARACIGLLEELDPDRYPPAHELVPGPAASPNTVEPPPVSLADVDSG